MNAYRKFFTETLASKGATFSVTDHMVIRPTSGFAVSLKGGTKIDLDNGQTPDEVFDPYFIDAVASVYGRAPFIGTWIDDNAILYVDATMIVLTLAEALTIAAEEEQLAIYDFSTGTVISMPVITVENVKA